MTTEDDFQRMLDENPGDHHTRLIFADFLQERDDPRADGYRALASQERQSPFYADKYYFWGDGSSPHLKEWMAATYDIYTSQTPDPRPQFKLCFLPRDWFRLLNKVRKTKDPMRTKNDPWQRFLTRAEAEDAAALAFYRLPTKRQAQLLAGVAV